MELYEYARPELCAGKKILYVHGFASSGASGTVKTMRLLLPKAEVIAPDLPVEPQEALDLLHGVVEQENPDLIIGTSMGGMYTELLHGHDRIIVNPAFQLADTILKNNGLGRREFHSPRADGMKDFMVTKGLLEAFREVSSHCFEDCDDEHLYGLFGTRDTLVDTYAMTAAHYSQCMHFEGEHYLNDSTFLHAVIPVIQWIDDRQSGTVRPSVFIAFDDVLRFSHNGEQVAAASRSVLELSRRYDLHFVLAAHPDDWDKAMAAREWMQQYIGVPTWNRTVLTSRKDTLLGDYLIDAHPDRFRGEDYMGTIINFGSSGFKDWAEVMTYFDRLGGQ